MSTKIQLRRDTSTNWTRNNPVLALGEPGLETDTLIVKYGDGSSSWNDLQYANLNSLADFTTNNLAESGNLYFTNARAYANVIAAGFISNTFATNAQLASYATNNQLTLYATNADLATYATLGDVYSNLLMLGHATNAQLDSYATFTTLADYATIERLGFYATNADIVLYATSSQVASLTTDNITESGNLYYSNARVETFLNSTSANLTLGSPLRLMRYTYDNMIAIASPQSGFIVFETSNNVFRGYDGTTWNVLG